MSAYGTIVWLLGISFIYWSYVGYVRHSVSRGRSRASGSKLLISGTIICVISASAWFPRTDLSITAVLSTFDRPEEEESLTPAYLRRILIAYNDAIVQTVEATERREYEMCMRLLMIGMSVVSTFMTLLKWQDAESVRNCDPAHKTGE